VIRHLSLAAAVAIYLATWWAVGALPPDAVGRRIAPLAFVAFVGALTVTAFFVARDAPKWFRVSVTLAAGPAAAACFARTAEPALPSLLGLGLVLAWATVVAFGAIPARRSDVDASS